jgi:hypothetical protein
MTTPAMLPTIASFGKRKGKQRSTSTGTPTAHTQATFQPTRQGDTDSDSVSSDDMDLEDIDLAVIWKRFDVIKVKRRHWIQEKAQTMVTNHISKFKVCLANEKFHRLFMAAVGSIAKQYAKALRAKASLRASTPLSNSYTR